MANDAQHTAHQIKEIATKLGFAFCGISKAAQLEAEAKLLEQWLQAGKHGKMQYMENHFDKRIDPRLLLPEAKSVITLMYNYYPNKELSADQYKISKYAYGKDYHVVIKDKLFAMVDDLRTQFGEIAARVFVDSAPVMEKAWAKRSGIGWQGKNTNIINPKAGSFYFLAVLICDLDAAADGPIKDYCGTCTACLDACPTDALTPYTIDAQKCISYLTIELKDELLPTSFSGQMDNWMFGCDVCQDVCPWNRFAKPHTEARFLPSTDLQKMHNADWEELTEDIFKKLFRNAAVKRTKYSGLKRNIEFLKKDK